MRDLTRASRREPPLLREEVEVRIVFDKCLGEVFASDRKAAGASLADYLGKPDRNAFAVGAPTTIKKLAAGKRNTN